SGSASTRPRSTGLGNVLGRVGSGLPVVALDGHMDTVGVGDHSNWTCDLPGRGAGGVAHGRGCAGDQEGAWRRRVHRGAHPQASRLRRRPAPGHRHRHGGGLRRPVCWKYLLEGRRPAPDLVVNTRHRPTSASTAASAAAWRWTSPTSGLPRTDSMPERGVQRGLQHRTRAWSRKPEPVSGQRPDRSRQGQRHHLRDPCRRPVALRGRRLRHPPPRPAAHRQGRPRRVGRRREIEAPWCAGTGAKVTGARLRGSRPAPACVT
ncbi:MAG: hypothetical protein IPM58_09610, partial [Nitrospira sp.]|nr:hypothetical protein [Nitrospira sp.]